MTSERASNDDIRITLIGKSNFEYFRDFVPQKKPEEKPLQDELLMFGAVYKDCAAGIMILGIRDETAEIMWIFVPQRFRSLGVAKRLMDEILKYAPRLRIKSFFSLYSNAFEASLMLDRLFMHCGFKITSAASFDYRFSFREFVELPGFKRATGGSGDRRSGGTGGRYLFLSLKQIPPEVIINSPIKSGYDLNVCDRDLSVLAFREKTLAGVLLVRDLGGRFNLEWLENYTTNPGVVTGLIVRACHAAGELFDSGKADSEKTISFQCIGNSGRAMVEKLFVNAPSETVWFHRAFLEV
ncbi:MAG: GNAT family N-acetyltransferase [Clostridia bacterium]|nr:GNAT family N-acetyltransferase [Clostridia bacterium]